MKTLFPANFQWTFFIGIAILFKLSFLDLSWFSYFAIILSLHQFILLFNSLGYVIPVRYLLGSFMCLQFFIGPTFAYNGLDQYQFEKYKMQIPEAQYFEYAIPAVLSFIIGLHLNAGKLKGEVVNKEGIILLVGKNPKLPYIFIIAGFLASILSSFVGSDLSFIFYLIGSFKFIGLFLLVLGNTQIRLVAFIVVISSIISSSLGNGMFHDLLTWTIFTASVLSIKYKFGIKVKLIGVAAFLLLSITIQLLKGGYREATNFGGQETGLETISNVYEKQNEKGSMFSFQNLAPSNVRINQGFIITNIMVTVPQKIPFSNGEEMYQIFEAAILPRFLAPNKLNSGDRELFMKYSGIKIRAGTSMALGSIGDAYINYGIFGGCLSMFLLGLLYSSILNIFHTKSRQYPILILFTALVFYYPIRPDCELQTILGHLFKSCFLITMLIFYFKDMFNPFTTVRDKFL